MDSDIPDTPEPQPGPPPDALARDIEHAANGVSVGDSQQLLATVHTRATHRRRRRNSLLGLAAAATIVVSGVAVTQVIGDDSGDDLVRTVSATEPSDTEPDAESDDTGPAGTELDDGAPDDAAAPTDADAAAPADADAGSTTAPDPEQDATPAASGDVAAIPVVPGAVSELADPDFASGGGSQHQLFAWKGGVLAVYTDYEPQPLPTELSEEISAAFPPEVRELFPDGLPPTIEEAITVLQEADLLGVVTEILAENPEVSDAIYSQSPPEPTRTLRFSADGEQWTDIDAVLPDGVDVWNATSTGERFVVTRPVANGEPLAGQGAPGATPSTPDAIEILSTTDLVDWSVQSIPVPEPSVAVDPALSRQVYVQRVAATESGFVMAFDASFDVGFGGFDIIELLDPELQGLANSGGYSIGQGADGVTIGLSDPDDPNDITETLTFTWDELGIDGPPPIDTAHSTYRYAGTWDGAPPILVDSTGGWSDVRAVGEVFVETGPSAQWSVDGLAWTSLEVPDGEMAVSIVDTGNGAAMVTNRASGETAIYVGDLGPDDWTPVTTPGLPDRAQVEMWGDGVMLLADYGGDSFIDPFADSVGMRESVEVDGYRYEMESSWGADGRGDDSVSTYRLIELATGTEVVSETVDNAQFDPQPYEYLDHDSGFGDGFRILDPATGEPLVTIPYESLTREIINEDGSVIDESDIDYPEPPMGPMNVEHWIVAFVSDGVIIERIETEGELGDDFPVSVIGLDDVVLVARANGVITRVAPA